MNAPCYKCTNKTVGCHSGCNKYIEYRSYMDSINESRKSFSRSKNIDLESVLRKTTIHVKYK
jgi:uncharacterized metal-binding protein